jgi:UDP-GlcNAc:undecaprenyl-phosphate GlcNAc-1-phosphate transferase
MWWTISVDNLSRLWLAAGSALLLALAATPLVRRWALAVGLVDRPAGGTRWSRRCVARMGGLAMTVAILGSTLLWVRVDRLVAGMLAGCVAVVILGAVDDVRRLRPYTKLLWQLALGSLMVLLGIRIELIHLPVWLSIPLSIFWFVFVMNAFNLLDNMDGLAAGVGAVTAAFCAFHATAAGDWTVAVLAAIVGGACAGFLRYNFPPAKIYMGDAGSHLLGLSLAALALLGSWDHSTRLISIMAVPMFVLAVPILDTCFVTIQRLTHGTHPFQGGRDHISHRLAILGLSTRQTVLVLYGVSGGFGLLSLILPQVKLPSAITMWLLLAAVVLLVGAFLATVKVYHAPAAEAEPDDEAARETPIGTMLLHKRRILEVLVDFALICGAYVGAHVLRFEGALTPDLQQLIVRSLPIVLLIKLACFSGAGLYRGVWRYISLPDVLAIVRGTVLGSVFSAAALLSLWRFEGYSRAVFIIDWLLVVVGVSAARVAGRLLHESIVTVAEGSKPVLIVGAGDTGELVLRQLKQHGRVRRRVVGFIDDDPGKQGIRIHGRSVLGSRDVLSDMIALYDVREVFVAMGRPPAELIRHVQDTCEPQAVTWKVVTAVTLESDALAVD